MLLNSKTFSASVNNCLLYISYVLKFVSCELINFRSNVKLLSLILNKRQLKFVASYFKNYATVIVAVPVFVLS